MTAPAFLSSRTTEVTTSSTSHVVNMPTTVNAGERLLWFTAVSDAGLHTSPQVSTTPSGWTLEYSKIVTEQYGYTHFYIWSRVADGSEGGTTKTLTMAQQSAYGEHMVLRFDNTADISNLVFGTESNFLYSSNPTAPSVTGAVDDQLLSVFAMTYNGEAGGSTPSGFTLVDKQAANSSAGPTLGIARKALTSAGSTGTSSWGTMTYGGTGVIFHLRIPKAVASQSLTPTGFANSSSFGSAELGLRLSASGLSSAVSYGAPKITLYLEPTGATFSAAFGAASITLYLEPTGLESSDVFGSPSIDQSAHLLPTGLSSTVAFGGPSLSLKLTATGVSSSSAFGAATVGYILSLSATGLSSTVAFGSASIAHTVGDTFTLTSVGSDDDAFGSPVVTNVFTISVAPAPDNDLFGSPTVAQVYFIRPTGFVYRGRGFGQPVVTGGVAPADPDPPAVATLQKYIPAPQPESNVSDREYVQTELQKVQQSISLLVEYLQGNA